MGIVFDDKAIVFCRTEGYSIILPDEYAAHS